MTRSSTGRRARRGGEEIAMFDERRAIAPSAGRAKRAKTRASRHARRSGRRSGWTD